ncbi:DUF986 family protein [Niastella populi]|uniref:Uncharacterized protein n=1 Tax=Niastella populi TaxID=550983 RepID=A0A1V9ERV4_9BACT|nr:DUF986 family protein [Niastella populi]OQP48888.1 hypothetical protein A4R26_07220 [Niastella populi]
MPKREKDIFSLYDPFIECGESLHVNINKRRSYGFYIGALVFFLVLTASSIYEGHLKAIIFASLSILCIAIICVVIYLRKNPVIVIDEKGIIKKEKFYSWEKIGSIKFESASDLEGSDNIKLNLKEGKPGRLNLEPLLFLDQKPKVIAAYIIKYFKVD